MKRWLLVAGQLGERLGRPGRIGIGLLVASATFFVSAVLPLQAELAQALGEAGSLQQRYQMSAGGEGKPRLTVEQQLSAFYDFFPAGASVPQWLGKVHAAAERNSLLLQTGEYKLLREKGWKLARYQITLPVRGSYPQVRAFLADALAAVPAMVLEDISLKRDSAGAAMLEARLRFTLYLGGA